MQPQKEGRQGILTAKPFSNRNRVVLVAEKSCYISSIKINRCVAQQVIPDQPESSCNLRWILLDCAIWVLLKLRLELQSNTETRPRCKKNPPKFLQMLRLRICFCFLDNRRECCLTPEESILTLRLRAIMPVEAVPPERRSSPGSGPPRSQRPSALTSANALHPAGREEEVERDREVICYGTENYRQARLATHNLARYVSSETIQDIRTHTHICSRLYLWCQTVTTAFESSLSLHTSVSAASSSQLA